MLDMVVIDAAIDIRIKREHIVPIKQTADCGICKPDNDKQYPDKNVADKE